MEQHSYWTFTVERWKARDWRGAVWGISMCVIHGPNSLVNF